MTCHIAAVGLYYYHHFIDHHRYWSTYLPQAQSIYGIGNLDQLALVVLEMDPGSMNGKRDHPKQNLYIQDDT